MIDENMSVNESRRHLLLVSSASVITPADDNAEGLLFASAFRRNDR